MRGAQNFGVVLKNSSDKRATLRRHEPTSQAAVNGDHRTKDSGEKNINTSKVSSPAKDSSKSHERQSDTFNAVPNHCNKLNGASISTPICTKGVVSNVFQNNKTEDKKPSLFTADDHHGTNKLLARNFLTHQLQRNRSVGAKVNLKSSAGNLKNTRTLIGSTSVHNSKATVYSPTETSDVYVHKHPVSQEQKIDTGFGRAVLGEKTVTTLSSASRENEKGTAFSERPFRNKNDITTTKSFVRVNQTKSTEVLNSTVKNTTSSKLGQLSSLSQDSVTKQLSTSECLTSNSIRHKKIASTTVSSASVSIKKAPNKLTISSEINIDNVVSAFTPVTKERSVITASEKCTSSDEVHDKKSDSADLEKCTSNIGECDNKCDLNSSLAKETSPEFTQTLEDISLQEGGVLTLIAKVKLGGNQAVQWLKDSVIIKSSPYVKTTFKDGTSTLTIRNVTMLNSGEYTCEVKNKIGLSRTICQVVVEKKPTPPVFKKRLQTTVNVIEGQKAELVVTVDGSPAPEVKWSYKNADLIETDRIHIIKVDDKQHKVVYDACEISDKGRIKCGIKNPAGSATCFCDLTVKAGPPKVKLISEPDISIEAGEDATFQLEGPSDGSRYKADWFKSNKPVSHNTKKYDVHVKDNLFTLVVKNVQDTDEGVYKCVLVGPGGRTTQEFKVSFKAPEEKAPKIFENSPEEVCTTIGESVRLEVKVTGYPLPVAVWLKGEEQLVDNGNIKISSKGDTYILELKNVSVDDDADYYCTLKNEHGVDKIMFSVITERKKTKPSFVEKLTDVTVEAGTEAEFAVVVDGYPEPKVQWKLHDVILEDEGRFQIFVENENNHILVIDSCKVDESGPVTCSATNEMGSVICTGTLEVAQQKEIIPEIKSCSDQKITLEEHKAIAIKAEISDAASVTWLHNGAPLKNGKGVDLKQDGDIYMLNISQATSSNAGEYIIEITSSTGHVVTKTFEVTVQGENVEKTVFKKILPQNIHVGKGETLHLEVELYTFVDADVMWEQNGDLLEEGDLISFGCIDGVHFLEIRKIQSDDEGEIEAFVECEGREEESCLCNIIVDGLVEKKKPDTTNKIGSPTSKQKVPPPGTKPRKKTTTADVKPNNQVDKSNQSEPMGSSNKDVTKKTKAPPPAIKAKKKTSVVKAENDPSIPVDIQEMIKQELAAQKQEEANKMIQHADVAELSEQEEGSKKETHREEGEDCILAIEEPMFAVKEEAVEAEIPIVDVDEDKIEFFVETKLKPIVVMCEDDARFCVILSKPADEYEWAVNGAEVNESDQREIYVEDCCYNLVFKNCSKKDDKKSIKFIGVCGDKEVTCSTRLTVQPLVPSLVRKCDVLPEYTVGDDIELTLQIKGYDDPEINWFKGFKKLSHVANRTELSVNDKLVQLTLKNVITADSGIYKCVVKSKSGSSELKFNIKIKAKKQEGSRPVIQPKFQDTSLKVGEKLIFEASVVGQPSPTVDWLINNKKLSNNRKVKISHEKNVHKLLVEDVTVDDSGEYKIVAKNRVASTSFSADVVVQEVGTSPVFVRVLKDMEVLDMEPVNFEVEVTNCDNMKWYVDDELISDDEDFEFKVDKDVYSFRIASINPEDTGRYECKASNKYGFTSSSCILTVNEDEPDIADGGDVKEREQEDNKEREEPPVILTELKENFIDVVEGETFAMTFNVSGKPSPEVNFYKDDAILDSTDHVKITSDGEKHNITICNLAKDDSGWYLIEAESDFGLVEKEFELIVAVKPKIKSPPPAAKPKPTKKEPAKVVPKPPATKKKPVPEPAVKPTPKVSEVITAKEDVTVESVKISKPIFTTKLHDVEVVEMSAVRFDVVAKGDPEIEFVWYKDNVKIDEKDRHYRIEEDGDEESALIIVEVEANDKGKYKCVATNDGGKATTTAELFVEVHGFASEDSESELGRSSTRTSTMDEDLSDDLLNEVDELEKAQIILPLCDKKAKVGESAEFSCRAQSITSEYSVDWYVNDVKKTSGSRVKLSVQDDGELFVFDINNLKVSDSGTYKIVFSAPSDKLECAAQLDVEDIVHVKEKTSVSDKKSKDVPKSHSGIKKEETAPPKVLAKSPRAPPPKPLSKPMKKRDVQIPAFTLKPRDRDSVAGMQVRLTASVTGKPTPAITWYKDGETLTKTKNVEITCNGSLSTLLIKSCTAEHAGTYKVIASNEGGEVTAEAELKVEDKKAKTVAPAVLKPKLLTILSDEVAEKGSDVSFKVEYEGQPKPEIQWEKNNHKIISMKRVKITEEKGLSELKITSCSTEDAGTYTVSATNIHGMDACNVRLDVKKASTGEETPPNICVEESISMKEEQGVEEAPADVMDDVDFEVAGINSNELGMKLLKIKELHPVLQREVTRHKFPGGSGIDVVVMPATPRDSPVTGAKPKIKEKPKDLELVVGETAEFELIVEDRTGVSVSWSKDGKLLFGSGRIKIWDKGDSFFMKITKLEVSDESLYECNVRNEHGKEVCDVELLVNETEDTEEDDDEEGIPPSFKTTLKEEYVVVDGDELTLEVQTDGEPPPKVAWYFEDKKFISSEEIQITSKGNKHSLKITEALLDDEGVYKCIASNEFGEISVQTEVFVDERDMGEQEEEKKEEDGGREEEEEKEPVVITHLTDEECLVGEEMKFEVEVLGCDVINWYANDVEYSRDDKRVIFHVKGDLYSLVITSVKMSDDGEIKVVASNKHGDVESSCDLLVEALDEENDDAFLDEIEDAADIKKEKQTPPPAPKPKPKKVPVAVKGDAPSFTSTLAARQVVEGNIARMDVRVKSETEVTPKWYCNDELISLSKFENITVLSDGDLHSLIIPEVKLLDTALYTCTVSNEFGEASCSADLLVMPNIAEVIDVTKDDDESKRRSTGMRSLEEVLSLSSYIAVEDQVVSNSDFLPIKKGDVVEILECSRQDMWLVRQASNVGSIGFVSPSILEKIEAKSEDSSPVVLETILDEKVLGMIAEEKEKIQASSYVAIGNYDPKIDQEIALNEGMLVELIDGQPQAEYWVVRVVNKDGTYGDEGLVPSTHLELREDKDETKRESVSVGKDEESKKNESIKHRGKVLEEMVQTEEKYIKQLTEVKQSHLAEMEEGVELPQALQGKSDVIFSNITDIHDFHAEIFFKEMKAAEKNHIMMADCFTKHASLMENLYVEYCNSRPAADEILDRPEIIEFWDEFQQETEDPHPLRAYLITPVQRITRYQLLLKEILKYTTRANEESSYIENALSQISAITRLANDSMHLKRIVGYESDSKLQKCGKVLKMDTLLCWDGAKARGKGKERQIFLCENVLIGTKRADSHKKDEIFYTYKFSMKVSDLGQTEYTGYPARWIVWCGKSASSATEQYTLEAKTEWEKSGWVRDIRELLAKQLDALKNSVKRQSMPPRPISEMSDVRPSIPPKTKNKPKLKHSKSEADMHGARLDGDEVTALTEKLDIVDSSREKQISKDLNDTEEQYLAAEYAGEICNMPLTTNLNIGELYRVKSDTKATGSQKFIVRQNDLVTLVKQGTSLYLVEPAGAEDSSKRTWVPGSYLLPLIEDAEELEEQDLPIFIKELSSITAQDGEDASFQCHCVNAETVEWYYESMQITEAEGVEMLMKDGVAELKLQNLCASDEGEYTAKALNSVGEATTSARLVVTEQATITEGLESITVSQCENVTFKCCYKGHPQPTLGWYLNNQLIRDEGKYIIETNATISILDIAEVEKNDAGEYKCVVKNSTGTDESVATLTVQTVEKPEVPGVPTVSKVTDKAVTLLWTASLSEVSHYMVEKRNVDSRADAWEIAEENVKGSSCTIDNLEYGERFYFRVIAVNRDIFSEPSGNTDKILIEAPRRKKTKRKSAKSGEESLSEEEVDGADSSKGLLSPTLDRKSTGRLSPFSQVRNRQRGGEDSSSDDDTNRERGRSTPRARSKSPSPLFSSTRKGRSRSKSPMRAMKTPGTPKTENGEVPFGPPYFTKELENCFVVEGGAARFTCRVSGNPEPEVNWYKDNEKLVESKQFTMLFDADENCVLIITRSNHDTAGSYTCQATNSEGTVKSSSILFVEGLQTEYDSETEEEVSDPEPQAEREEVKIKKEDVESYYVLKEELGRGKFGVVTKCVDKLTNVEYAAKFIKCRPSERKNVINEIELMNILNHKRLINLIAAFESSRQIVLVLELVTGGELFEKLTEEEFISEKDVTFYMKQVLQGVQHMHEREVLHLDLKPENIMLVNQRSTQIKLIDFGLARRYKKGDSLKVLFGTPEFMAPEVINYEEVTPQTDMWSIGVITYVLLSGLSPFAGDNDSETLTNVTSGEWDFDDPVFEDISDEAKDFIQELLVKNQKERATVKDCLDHPWFMFKKFKKKIRTDRLKAFTARRKWKKTITAVRSTNFLTRLLTGIKAAHAAESSAKEGKTEERKSTSSNTGPAWKRAEDVEDDESLAPEFSEKLHDLKIINGEVAHFQAKFKKQGEEVPIVSWKKEGKETVENKRVHSSVMDNVMHFKILNASVSDTARYTVRLENQHGSTECSSQLIVQDVPGPPAAPNVPQVLSTSALVQWRAGFDGNSPITSYTLQYRKLGDKEWSVFAAAIKEVVTVVEDLEPSSSYRFRLCANNEVGSGEMSEPTSLIETPEMNQKDKRDSINAPGARRVSRSSSIRVQNELKVKEKVADVRLKEENPENYYNLKEEIGRGKFAVVKKCVSKGGGDTYAAKMVKYDEDTIDVTKKEFEIWKELSHENLVNLHDAFLVRKYLVLVCDLVKGQPVLNHLSSLTVPTENDVANCIEQLLLALDYLHQCDICHLDIKPGNIVMRGPSLKLIDYGSSRRVVTKGGDVGETVGTAEFMAPETINFEPVTGKTDIWSVGVVTYALLSGISPFAADDEDETMASITALDYRFEATAFATITEEAKTFIKSLIIRVPEKRPTADLCLEDPWLSDAVEDSRLASSINADALVDLAEILEEQDEMESVHASLVLRTFLQSPYDSPESESEEDDEDEDV